MASVPQRDANSLLHLRRENDKLKQENEHLKWVLNSIRRMITSVQRDDEVGSSER